MGGLLHSRVKWITACLKSLLSVHQGCTGCARVDVVAYATHPGELAFIHGAELKGCKCLFHVLHIVRPGEAHVDLWVAEREAVAIGAGGRCNSFRHLRRIHQVAPACCCIRDHAGTFRGLAFCQSRKYLVLRAAVNRVVTHVPGRVRLVIKQGGEQTSVVGRKGDRADTAFLLEL